MKRIVLTTIGSLGDLHPVMGVARELESRGHRTVIGTSQFYKNYIESAGLNFTPIGPHMDPTSKELIAEIMRPRTGPEQLYTKHVFPHLKQAVEELRRVAEGADVIVGSILSYHVSIVSELTGIPWISALLSPLAMWSGYEPPLIAEIPWLGRMRFLGPRFHRAVLGGLLKISERWARSLQETRKSYGLKKLEHPLSTGVMSPHMTLCLWSPIFGAHQPDWPSSAQTCGFVYYDPKEDHPLSPEVERFLERESAPAIFTLGSTAVHAWQPAIECFFEAAGRLPCRSLMCIGRAGMERFRHKNSDQVCVTDYIPYGRILSQGALTIHQGGVGTTAQGMLSGKPTLILPMAFDQFDNAERVRRLGISGILPLKKLSTDRLSENIEYLLGDEKTKSKAFEIGASVKTENGTKSAADLILGLIG